jgi:voltage-gated potassium channel
MLFLLRKIGNIKTFKIFLHFLLSTFFYAFLYNYFGTFNIPSGEDEEEDYQLDFFHAFYFSLVTQTTVGYGDISPKDNTTKVICMSQLLLTIIIMAIGMR